MANFTRRGLLGGLAALGLAPIAAAFPKVTDKLGGVVPLSEELTGKIAAVAPDLVNPSPKRCRVCDRVFNASEAKHPFLDFYFVDMGRKEPYPPVRDYVLTSGVDMACTRCFKKFTYGVGTLEEREKSWTPMEHSIWAEYKHKMFQRPR